MNNYNDRFTKYALWSCAFFVLTVLKFKFFGELSGKGFNFDDKTPYTWSQIYDILPTFIVGSLVFGVFAGEINVQVNKKQKQDIEAARKRIAEREKDGGKSKTLVDEIVKDVMKSSKQEEETPEKE